MDEQQLINAVIEALTFDDSEDQVGFTTSELADKLGWTRYKVLSALHILEKQGRLDSFKKPTRKITGETNWSPAYYLVSDGHPNEGRD